MTGGWRDMSTAPRDGTVIELGWRFDDTSWLAASAGWGGARWLAVNGEMACELPDPTGWRPLGGTPRPALRNPTSVAD